MVAFIELYMVTPQDFITLAKHKLFLTAICAFVATCKVLAIRVTLNGAKMTLTHLAARLIGVAEIRYSAWLNWCGRFLMHVVRILVQNSGEGIELDVF